MTETASGKKRIKSIGKKGISRVAKCPEDLEIALHLVDLQRFPLKAHDRGLPVIQRLVPLSSLLPTSDPDRVRKELRFEMSSFATHLLTAAAKKIKGRIFTELCLCVRDGKFVIEPQELCQWMLDALNGVDASRIKRCEVCGKPFWAGRKDKQGCSKEHCDVIAHRRWRKRYHDQGGYKAQRYRQAEKRGRG